MPPWPSAFPYLYHFSIIVNHHTKNAYLTTRRKHIIHTSESMSHWRLMHDKENFHHKRHHLTPVVLNLCPPCLCTQNKGRHLRQKWKGTNNNKKLSYLSIRLVCFSLTQYAGLLAAPFFWPQAARAPNLGFRCLQTLKGSIEKARSPGGKRERAIVSTAERERAAPRKTKSRVPEEETAPALFTFSVFDLFLIKHPFVSRHPWLPRPPSLNPEPYYINL